MLNGKVVLVTGGSGSFGRKFIQMALEKYKLRKLIVFSRDELKQFEMRSQFSEERYPELRYFIGDVRDKERLLRAFHGVDVVVHAAALKQVTTCEYNPIEAIRTNIDGAMNIVDAAIDRKVEKVIALSTDKAANPINLYGATKLCSDKLFVNGNAYAGDSKTKFAVVRYGNVVGSRGSVVPFFMKEKEKGELPITDERMTRFWITLEQGVQFVMNSLDRMHGGEIFVPKLPATNMMDLAKAIAPDCKIKFVGIRPGEKIHEVLVPEDDARRTIEFDNYYIIQPEHKFWKLDQTAYKGGKPCPEGFSYNSFNNTERLTINQIKDMIGLKVTLDG